MCKVGRKCGCFGCVWVSGSMNKCQLLYQFLSQESCAYINSPDLIFNQSTHQFAINSLRGIPFKSVRGGGGRGKGGGGPGGFLKGGRGRILNLFIPLDCIWFLAGRGGGGGGCRIFNYLLFLPPQHF